MAQQKSTEWAPTPRQAKVLEAAQEAGLNRNISTICEEAGVNRTSFYRWLKEDTGFKAAWQDIWRSSITRHMPAVVAAQVRKAEEGDTNAAKLLSDLAGVLKQKVEHTGDMTIVVKKPDDLTE